MNYGPTVVLGFAQGTHLFGKNITTVHYTSSNIVRLGRQTL
jgi:hypothetical protein